mgnify:FL=1
MNKININETNNPMKWNQYISEMKENQDDLKRISNKVLSDINLRNKVTELNQKLANSSIMILTEDFCPDSLFNLPVFILISELIPSIELNIFKRSENVNLNKEFISNGLDRIPAVLIFNKDNQIKYKWQEKPAKAYKVQEEILKKIKNMNGISESDLKKKYYDESEIQYENVLWIETINEIHKL